MSTVLVLDDRATDRELLVTLLAHAGHRALETHAGDEALAILRDQRPDLVIADMLMPRMDGYEFVRELRGDPRIAHTPVIFYSATYDDGELYALARACGVARVIQKPADPKLLLAAVAEVLEAGPDRPGPPSEEADREHERLVRARERGSE